jgi:hypothetical protein
MTNFQELWNIIKRQNPRINRVKSTGIANLFKRKKEKKTYSIEL